MEESIRLWGGYSSSLGRQGLLLFCLFLSCLLYKFIKLQNAIHMFFLPSSGSEADPLLYPRAEKTMTFTHHRPWQSLKIDPRKDVGLAGFCRRTVYRGKSGGRDFRKRKGEEQRHRPRETGAVLEYVPRATP